MKKLAFAIALFTAAPAFSGTCKLPAGLPKITGLDYHTARAMLIKAGFFPTPYNPTTTGGAPQSDHAQTYGYFEAPSIANGTPGASWKTSNGKPFYIFEKSPGAFLISCHPIN